MDPEGILLERERESQRQGGLIWLHPLDGAPRNFIARRLEFNPVN